MHNNEEPFIRMIIISPTPEAEIPSYVNLKSSIFYQKTH